MLSINDVAAEAYDALSAPQLIEPFSDRGFAPAAKDAYAATALLREARGARVVGRKIGFTNRAIWPLYGVDGPIWGDVTETSLLEGGSVDLLPYAQPRLEPEIVLALKSAPEAGMTEADLAQCIDWVAPGFEVVQSIYPDWRFAPSDTIIAGGLHGALLIGAKTEATAAVLAGLPDVAVCLKKNGEEVETGRGANALDGPLSALRHLNDLLADDRHNPPLAAGEVITTGTLTDAWPMSSGDRWSAQYSGAMNAELSLSCQ